MGTLVGRTRTLRIVVVLILLVWGAGLTPAPLSADVREGGRVTIMTQNLYLGADLVPVLTAPDFPSFQAALKAAWDEVQATNFPERAWAIAEQIKKRKPDLIAVQEAVLWRTGALFNPAPAEDVRFDFLQILLDALAAFGLDYTPAVPVTNIDVEVPLVVDGIDVRLTDRGAILVRDDLEISNPQAANFETLLVVSVQGSPVPVKRGWMAVDVEVRGERFRFVNAHLEALAPIVRDVQTNELLAGPLKTADPVVLVGDLNATPGEPGTYGKLIADGFRDAWTKGEPDDPGFTCCQAPHLRNGVSSLDRRIDFVLLRDGVGSAQSRIRNIELLGEEAGDRTPSGLWFSDHAGIQTRLRLRMDDD